MNQTRPYKLCLAHHMKTVYNSLLCQKSWIRGVQAHDSDQLISSLKSEADDSQRHDCTSRCELITVAYNLASRGPQPRVLDGVSFLNSLSKLIKGSKQ